MGQKERAAQIVGLLIAVGLYSSALNASSYVATLSSEKLDTLHQALTCPSLERALYATAATVRGMKNNQKKVGSPAWRPA